MVTENMLARSLLIGESTRLDNSCKKVLANKIILAWIMKYSMSEYADCEIPEIVSHYIEGTPVIAGIAVHQDEVAQEMITGMNTESISINEGTVTYDIRFYALHPVSGDRMKLIINIEAQNAYYPGYPLIKRGIYYGGRMLSSQYGTEFTRQEYGKIKKVYSIWVCMNAPQNRQNTINRYEIEEKQLVGAVREKKEYYDLLTVTMIGLGKWKDTSSPLLQVLDILFWEELPVQEKLYLLQTEFKIETTQKLEKEVNEMCNMSMGYLERGMERGMERGILTSICNLMDSMKWTIEQAMDALQIPEEKRAFYRAKITEN